MFVDLGDNSRHLWMLSFWIIMLFNENRCENTHRPRLIQHHYTAVNYTQQWHIVEYEDYEAFHVQRSYEQLSSWSLGIDVRALVFFFNWILSCFCRTPLKISGMAKSRTSLSAQVNPGQFPPPMSVHERCSRAAMLDPSHPKSMGPCLIFPSNCPTKA